MELTILYQNALLNKLPKWCTAIFPPNVRELPKMQNPRYLSVELKNYSKATANDLFLKKHFFYNRFSIFLSLKNHNNNESIKHQITGRDTLKTFSTKFGWYQVFPSKYFFIRFFIKKIGLEKHSALC